MVLKNLVKIGHCFLLISLLSACQKDLRTTVVKKNEQDNLVSKGRALLEEAYAAHGMDELLTYETYEITSNYDYRFPWPLMNMNVFKVRSQDTVQLRYAVNTFDGQMEYLTGKRAGNIYGTQSFQSYQEKTGSSIQFDKEKRRAWGVTAFHYLLEIPLRIQQATIIKYAGQKKYNGVVYDLVFATWETEKPNNTYDHWLLYINPNTHRIDLLNATIKEYYMPIPAFMYATVLYNDYRKVGDNLIMPHRLTIQAFKPKKKEKKKVYTMHFKDFRFDSFPKSKLYPNKNLPEYGDSKPTR